MKFNLLINQKAAKEFNDILLAKYESNNTPKNERVLLDFTHMVILDLAVNLHIFKGCIKINSDGVDYYLLSYKFIIDQLPLLACSKQTVYRYLKDICDMGLMLPHPDNQKMGGAYYRLTNNIEVFHFSAPYVKNDTPPISKMTDYNITNKEEEGFALQDALERKKIEIKEYLSSDPPRLQNSNRLIELNLYTFDELFEEYWLTSGSMQRGKQNAWYQRGFQMFLDMKITKDLEAIKKQESKKQKTSTPVDPSAPWRKDYPVNWNNPDAYKDDTTGRYNS